MPITKATASSIAPAAKGDLVVGSATNDAAVLGVGSNDQVLTADSSTATGLKWASAASGGMTLINTGGTTLTGSTVTVSSIPTTYINLYIVIRDWLPATDNVYLTMRVNSDSNANRYDDDNPAAYGNKSFDSTFWIVGNFADNSVGTNLSAVTLYDYANTDTWKIGNTWGVSVNPSTTTQYNANGNMMFYNQTSAITSIDLGLSSGNFTSGTVFVYGVK